MPRKKKLKELKQTDGKAEPAKPTTLDQIWGNTGLTKYGTADVEEYKEYIKKNIRTRPLQKAFAEWQSKFFN